MSPQRIQLPNGVTLNSQPKTNGCTGCWFELNLGGCIGYLKCQPGCGELTRADGQEIIWVDQSKKGGAS